MLLIFLALRQVALLLGLAEGHLPSRITYYSNYYTVVIELLSLKGHLSLPKMQHAWDLGGYSANVPFEDGVHLQN